MTMTLAPSNPAQQPAGLLVLSDKEFRRIRTLLYARFGIHLADGKRLLVQGRLSKEIKTRGYRTFSEYMDDLEHNPDNGKLLALVDKISTNHSYFFREPDHFEFLTTVVLPSLEREGVQPDQVRIWCAGAAEGQEPYTTAMVLHDYFGRALSGTQPLILATDISVTALQQANRGTYPVAVLSSVPQRFQRYLNRLDDSTITVTEAIRKLVLFKRLNLHQERYPLQRRFHVIMCRNVMIYFDTATRTQLVARFGSYLSDDGYLFIGHSESLGRSVQGYRYLRPAVYQRCR